MVDNVLLILEYLATFLAGCLAAAAAGAGAGVLVLAVLLPNLDGAETLILFLCFCLTSFSSSGMVGSFTGSSDRYSLLFYSDRLMID